MGVSVDENVLVYWAVAFDVRTVMSFGVHGMWLGETNAGLTAQCYRKTQRWVSPTAGLRRTRSSPTHSFV